MNAVTRLILLVVIGFSSSSVAQSPWRANSNPSQHATGLSEIATEGSTLVLDESRLREELAKKTADFSVTIPLPDGRFEVFVLKPVSVMAASLAQKYPQIRTFQGRSSTNSQHYGRFDLSPAGFSGMVKYQGKWVIITFDKDPESHNYYSYFAHHELAMQDSHQSRQNPLSLPASVKSSLSNRSQSVQAKANGDQVRTFRLAISASAEYTRANGGEAQTLAELVRLVNRLNQVFLVDLAIRFELVANNDRLIFSDVDTDPFSNSDPAEDIEANQAIIDELIGSNNYDLGHLVNTDPGGLATLQSICVNGFKARGQSGSTRPTGESFYIQLVIHEFGHQLGAAHTFNAQGEGACTEDQRSRNDAVEPGSGSTIMSYAGLCDAQDLQRNSDPYFHANSINEIQTNLDRRVCGTIDQTGNAIPLVLSDNIIHTIPANSAFVLSAQVMDADNDPLSFSWDQIDPGGFEGATETEAQRDTDNGFNPLFRSLPPGNNPTRYFPNLDDVLANRVSDGEVYPGTDRQLNFQLVVRDNQGGINTLDADIAVVTTAEPFLVESPAFQSNWVGGQPQTVSWQVGETDLSPISCSEVDILLDADGNNVFETRLAENSPNDGQQEVVSPSTNSTAARVMVKCSDNVFFAVNSGPFNIEPGATPVAPLIVSQNPKSSLEDTPFDIAFSDLNVNDPDTAYPDNFTLLLAAGQNYSFSNTRVTPAANFNGTLSINVAVNDGVSNSNIFPLQVTVTAVNDPPIATGEQATVQQNASATLFDVLSNDTDPDGDPLTLTEVSYTGDGQVELVNNQISYTPAADFSGTETIGYTLQDSFFETSSATLTVLVLAAAPPPESPPTSPPVTPASPDSGGGGAMGLSLLLLVLVRLFSSQAQARRRNE